MSAVLLADVKDFLNIPNDNDDPELQRMVDRAESILARRVGPLEPVMVTDEVHTGPGPLVLKQYPVVSVGSATSGGVAVTDMELDADSGVVYGSFYGSARGVRVTYTAGRSTLPADLEAAVLELVKHLWDSQRVPGTRTTRPGFGQGDAPSGSGYLLPYRVQSLIEPFLVPVIA